MAKKSFRTVPAEAPRYPRPAELTGPALREWRRWVIGSLMMGAVAATPTGTRAAEKPDAGPPPPILRGGRMPAPRDIDLGLPREAKPEKGAPATKPSKDKPKKPPRIVPVPRPMGTALPPREAKPPAEPAKAPKSVKASKPATTPKASEAPTPSPAPTKAPKKQR
jgi:hypothetical protein